MTRPARWLVAVALAVLFTAFQIQSSIHSGSLSLPVTYDDVGYFNDALGRLDLLYREGGRAFLSTFWTNPPHAPLQTLLALSGFGIFGAHQWAGAAMNAVPLGILLALVLGYASRVLAPSVASTVTASLLGFPLLGLLVLECRPDMLCSLLTAAGALIAAADPRWRTGDRPVMGMVVALLVGALLAKPTLAPVTVVVFGAAAAAAVLQAPDKARAIQRALLAGAVAALLVLPYYVAVAPRLYDYITVNAFGSQASIWAKNAATPNPALYYLTGPGGKAAIGTPWLALTGALVLASAPLCIRSWRSSAAVVAVAAIAYAGVTAPSMKSPFLGLVVPALVLGIAVVAMLNLLPKLPRNAALAAAVALLAFSALTWRPVSLRLWGWPVPHTQSQHFSRIYEQTVDALAAVPELERRKVYFPVIGQYLNPENIEFALRQQGRPLPSAVMANYFDADIASHQRQMGASDVAVLFSDESTLPLPWPASASIRREITAAAAASGFVEVAAIDGGPYLGKVRILVRR